MSNSESHSDSHHDSHDDNRYKKRCYCQRCVKTYDSWCKRHKKAGRPVCKRKCYTVCEIVCDKKTVVDKHWGYKRKYEGKWQSFHGKDREPGHKGTEGEVENGTHDSFVDGKYKKRCYCEKCVATYDAWCRRHKEAGHTVCKRKCYTVCEVVCEKETVINKHWGHKRRYEGKWEPFHGKPREPRRCKKGCRSHQSGGHSSSD